MSKEELVNKIEEVDAELAELKEDRDSASYANNRDIGRGEKAGPILKEGQPGFEDNANKREQLKKLRQELQTKLDNF